jgi:GTP-binding protein HflX
VHDELISVELGRFLAQISADLNRQIGVIISRKGAITHVIVGDAKGVFLPSLADYPVGRRALRGLRYIHTHLHDEPLNQDDFTDLALLRFDAVAAIGLKDEQPDRIYIAHLLPQGAGATYEVMPPADFHSLKFDFRSFINALEEELERARAFEQ